MPEQVDLLSEWTDQSISTIHHALRAPRRRLTIGLVANWPYRYSESPDGDDTGIWCSPDEDFEEIEVRSLARDIAAIEQEVAVEEASGKPYHSVYTTLSQTHLPELDDAGALMYDGDRQTVKPDRNMPALMVAAVGTSSVSRLYFNDSSAECYAGGANAQDSITD